MGGGGGGLFFFFFFSSRRRHTRLVRDWSSDVCSSDLGRERVVWQSDDQGTTWTRDPNGALPGPDPSLVPDGNGGWIMFYKTMERG